MPSRRAEVEFVINAREPALGVGIRVRTDHERETYKFVNGGERSFKIAYCKLYMKPAHNVSPETRALLVPPPPPPPPKPKPVAVAAQHTDTKLEKAIAAAPDAEAPYRAYAAWLGERGDPRAELIAVQCERASAPKNRRLAAEEARLLETHGAYVMPPLLAQAIEATKRSKTARCEVEWYCGYLKNVRLAREDVRRLQHLDFSAVARELVDHPSATFLRALVIDGAIDATKIVGALGGRKLSVLERLVVRGGATLKVTKKLTHARLRELVLETSSASAVELDGLLTGYFPALETFELRSSVLELSAEQLTHLRLDDFAPKLEQLALRGISGSAALLDALVRSELVSRLTRLVVAATDLDDTVVGQYQPRLAHITELALEHVGPKTPAGSMPDPVREHEVMRSAPDPQSADAARKIADASKWMALGFDPRRRWLWGEYEGRDHYYVFSALRGRERGCDCGSAKDPCKHVLALRLLAARQHPFEDRPAPDTLVRNASRERPSYRRDYDEDW